jgi:hypothetical protein
MPRLRLLRRLLGIHDQKNPSAAILRLSLDILLLITDYLALHDKFLLSHTCKALRQITSKDWVIELSQLSFEDQIGFWAGLAYTLPSHWACLNCCKLHPIDTSDVPAASGAVRYGSVSIRHYHIQFALKLSRLGNVHQKYLKALMQTYTRTGPALKPPIVKSYAAEPRMINNHFILREEWNMINNTSTVMPLFPDYFTPWLPICPHMELRGGLVRSRWVKESVINYIVHTSHNISMLQGSIWLKEVTLLEDGIALAYESPGQWIFNSCLHCPTDLAVKISTDEREATIRAWHDFGIEGSPMDISWKAHVNNRNRKQWLDIGPYLDYTHGSIRESWSEEVSRGAETSHAKLRNVFAKLKIA